MIVSLTQAGIDLLNAGTGPFIVNEFQFGDGFNYTPSPSDTNIHGAQVYTATPNAPEAADGNTYIFSVQLDLTVGDFNFGEIGLRIQDGTLVALAASNTLVEKIKQTGTVDGNVITVDVYLRIQGQNYDVWIDSQATSNQYKIPTLQNVDQLPAATMAIPNVYILASSLQVGSSLAYTDRQFVWTFSEYYYLAVAPVKAASLTSITIDRSFSVPEMFPDYLGEVITQLTDAQNPKLQGISRNVAVTVESGNDLTFNFDTPLTIVPVVGSKVTIYNRKAASSNPPPPYELPPATTTDLGGVIVGDGLNVAVDGTLSTNAIQPGGAGSIFHGDNPEAAPAQGSRNTTFSLPAGMQIRQPIVDTYDVATGEKISIPIENVVIETGQCTVTYSTSVAVQVRVVIMAQVKAP